MKHRSSESFNSVFLHVSYYPTIRKHLWLEQSALTPSAGWPSMRDCFNGLEDSSNYSASVYKQMSLKYEFYHRKGVSQMLYVSRQSCLLHYGDHYIPCRSTLYRLEVMSQCCNNFSYKLCPYMFPLSIIESKIKALTNGGTSCQCCLPLRALMLLPPIT